MANEVTVEIKGLDALQDALEELKGKAGTKTIREAARDGAALVRDAMAAEAPKDTGLLSEHFDVKTRKVTGEDLAVSAFVGPNAKQVIHPQSKGTTASDKRSAALISWFLEFGTSRMGKKPFLTRAFETSKQAALEKIISSLKARLGFS